MIERSQSDDSLIAEHPDVNDGYPVIAMTRIGVPLIVEAFRELGELDATVEAFPQLTRAQVEAALDYYREHRQRVDEDTERNQQTLDELRDCRRGGS